MKYVDIERRKAKDYTQYALVEGWLVMRVDSPSLLYFSVFAALLNFSAANSEFAMPSGWQCEMRVCSAFSFSFSSIRTGNWQLAAEEPE